MSNYDWIILGSKASEQFTPGEYHTAQFMGGHGDSVASAVIHHFVEIACFNYIHRVSETRASSRGFYLSMSHKNSCSAEEKVEVAVVIKSLFIDMVRFDFEITSLERKHIIGLGFHDRKIDLV